MTTEENSQSSDITKKNGDADDERHEHDDDESTKSETSSAQPVRRSRFFRSKRKQRLNEDQSHHVETNDDDDDHNTSSAEPPTESSKNSQQTSEENLTTEPDDLSVVPTTTKRRSLSPPPPLPSNDDDDTTIEQDTSGSSEEPPNFTCSIDDIDAERDAYLANKKAHELKVLAQSRPSLPTVFSGYQRKKSQSVKLIRLDPFDACPKKNVRFADDFGLDLSQVKMIKSDELPHVPSAAFKDLHISNEESATNVYQERTKTITYLEQQFENPLHSHGFDDRVSRHKVVLEQANAIDNRIYGTIKIVSFGFNKRVKVRLTVDNWMSYIDHDATYILDSFDGTYDRFTFTLEIARDRICVGNNIQFCIGYESYAGPEYWDNNYHQNYRFDCISRTIPDYSS
ncbi:unnamed protein product [Adineta ricciae]|uniref:CBM21 domain-containing protein n=1 Tax=Adineta ricciae TaxID=249248 RepID=A0A813RGA3_ADIRI|nr:unnamed protein product [Adineta ricciae]